MAEETIIEYNARWKAWGDGAGGYRDVRPAGAFWPQPPAMPASGGDWANFGDTDCGLGKSYRDWFANDAPQQSGGNSPPPPPPTRRKN